MAGRLYRDDPLSPQQRDEYERDIIAFCDCELDLLGEIRGKNVLYAGGKSPLWIEGLAQRIGARGSLTVLDLDSEGLGSAERFFSPEDLPLQPEYVIGDVFDLPFERGLFDLVYSSGLLHELDVSGGSALDALVAMASALRPGGRLATSDFVNDTDAVQLEDEAIEAEAKRLSSDVNLYGIWSSERLVGLHRDVLADLRWKLHPPSEIRHLDKLVLASEPPEVSRISNEDRPLLRARWKSFLDRIKKEGYTRPATLFVEGTAKES